MKGAHIEAVLAARFPDPAARDAEIRKLADNWAQKWDANSLVILWRALIGLNTVPDFPKIKARMLYVLSRSDPIFPPKICHEVMHALRNAGVNVRYFEIDSGFGHLAAFREQEKLAPPLGDFLAPLIARKTSAAGHG
jgi:homoserine O-acetyltransferase/O-succinyltransferase